MKNQAIDLAELKSIPQQKWEKLAAQKIFFGHQSVGNNIIHGLKLICQENPDITLNIQQNREIEIFQTPVFAHDRIGENKDPISKIYDFKTIMESGVGNAVQIAFFKFCYIDIMADTDIDKVFSVYKNTMTELSQLFPDVTFIHVTVPLRTVQTGLRVKIKKIIGRAIGGYDDNIKRNLFNDLLRSKYQKEGIIFDLAKIESTFSDGSRKILEDNGKIYHALVPDYTEDGGHLNEKGQRIIAKELLLKLIECITESSRYLNM